MLQEPRTYQSQSIYIRNRVHGLWMDPGRILHVTRTFVLVLDQDLKDLCFNVYICPPFTIEWFHEQPLILTARRQQMRTYNDTTVTEIAMSDIDRTYRGDTGCACGCGGNYYDIDDAQNQDEVNRRVKYVLRGIRDGKAEFFGNGVEVANPSYTRVTRLYFKDGIDYNRLASGNLKRTQEGPRVMDSLTREQVGFMKSTGLPEYYMIQKIVFQYAEGNMSESEYSEFYASWTSSNKDQADELVSKISSMISRELKVSA